MKLVGIHGDEGKAAGAMGMKRAELSRLLEDEDFRGRLEREKANVADAADWMQILFKAKIEPHMGMAEKNAKGRKSQVTVRAAWVAYRGLRRERGMVLLEVNANNKDFFIALGRLLSGDLKMRLWDETDETIARNWSSRLREGVEI